MDVSELHKEGPQPRNGKQACILVLDDEESVGALVRASLSRASYHTVWCSEASSAIAAIDEEPPDLALVDVTLGNGTGWEVLKYIRSNPATVHVPIVMMTGSSDTLDRERSLRMGADRFLIKPVRPETLRRVIAEMLSARDDLWWAVTLRPEEAERLRDLFFDANTAVPTLTAVVDELRGLIESGEMLQVFCLEIEPLFRLGEREHWDALDVLRREFVRGLRVLVSPLLGNDAVIAISHAGANDFYIFTRHPGVTSEQAKTARELERLGRTALRTMTVDPRIVDEITIFAGGAVTQPHPVFAPRILYNAVREAKDNAERRETRFYHALRERLVRAVREKTITTVFQPVLDLQSRTVIGFEALSRGPAGTEIENPEVIFEIARDFDLVWELENLCIENVSPNLTQLCQRGLLFFNLESNFIQQLQHRGTSVFDAFLQCHYQVVIEVTERSAIRDYRTFRHTLRELKTMGFRIAIDDCGSGYATLEAVAELQPDYLKVGHSLFHGVERDPIRRRLVDLVARCADTIGAKTIAEAIETEEQLKVSQDLGISYGQGFLFSSAQPWEIIRDFQAAPARS